MKTFLAMNRHEIETAMELADALRELGVIA